MADSITSQPLVQVAAQVGIFIGGLALNWVSQATFPAVQRAVVSLKSGWRGYRIARATNKWSVARYIRRRPNSALALGLASLTQLLYFSVFLLLFGHPSSKSMWITLFNLTWSTVMFFSIVRFYFSAVNWFHIYSDPEEHEAATYKALSKLEGGYGVEDGDESEQSQRFETQAEMNARAVSAYEADNSALDIAIGTLSELLSPNELEQFQKSQRLWANHRKFEGDIAAEQVAGGSMEPSVRYATMQELTTQRLDQIKGMIAQRRRDA